MGKVLYESTLEIEDTKNPDWRSRMGEPTVWIQYSGHIIQLNGQPASGSVLVGYIQEPTAMSGDSDTPDPRIPEFFHQYLKFAAASWLLTQAGQAQDLKKAADYYSRFLTGIGVGNLPLASKNVRR